MDNDELKKHREDVLRRHREQCKKCKEVPPHKWKLCEVGRILSCIGNKVTFKYPEGDRTGILVDRMVIESANEDGAVPYWDVVDLMEFEKEKEKWLRIGYYRKPKKSLVFGGQTSITETISIWKKILVITAREKKWFRDILVDVMKELK